VTVERRLSAAAACLVGGAVVAYMAFATGAVLGGVLVIMLALLTLALALVGDAPPVLRSLGEAALALLPGAMLAYFAFNGGGYFPATQGFAASVLAVALALRIALVRDPFAGFNRWLAVAVGALSLYTLWTLVSGSWSTSGTARPLLETGRSLLYLLALVLVGSVPRTSARMRWMLRGLAASAVLVCAIGLVTRLLPHTWPIAPNVGQERLSYPLTYWNALGLVAAIAVILCLHLTTTRRERAAAQILGAAAIPLAAVTLYFTFSRGGIAACAIGSAAYLVLARPRALVGGLLAAVPASAIAVARAYGSHALSSTQPASAAAVIEGRHVALVLAACIVGAGMLRAVTLPLDARIGRLALPARARVPVMRAAWAGAVVAVLAVAVAASTSHTLSRQYHRFVNGDVVSTGGDVRARLTDPGNNHRLDQWRVAVKAWRADPVEGQGAGTYELAWDRRRPYFFVIHDAHSLYLETMTELGLAGLVLLAVALLAILARLATRATGARRSLYAAAFSIGLAWALHAGVDWDWEMPAVTAWLFLVGGAALATPARLARARRVPPAGRVVLVCLVAALALFPARLAVSDSRLSEAFDAFAKGDCPAAEARAADSLAAVSARPEPYAIRGYCRLAEGRPAPAVRAMQQAIDRDPGDPAYRYGMALARARAGLDPRPAVVQARLRDPRNRLYAETLVAFSITPASRWSAVAARAPVPARF
jgi:O-antigen ligase